MTIEELLNKRYVLALIPQGSLSPKTKAKVLLALVRMNRICEEVEKDREELLGKLKPDGFDELMKNEERTGEEQKQLDEMLDKLNAEFAPIWKEKMAEDAGYDFILTEDMFVQLLEDLQDAEVTREENGQTVSIKDALFAELAGMVQ